MKANHTSSSIHTSSNRAPHQRRSLNSLILAAVAVALGLSGAVVNAADDLWISASSTAWLTAANWTGSHLPTGTDNAQFGANPTSATAAIGVNGNGTLVPGSQVEDLGAIELTSARGSLNITIGNSSTTAGKDFILNLKGTTVNGVPYTILRNAGTGTTKLTLQNISGSGTLTMGVRIDNSAALIDATSAIVISSILSSSTSGYGFTKTGGGTLTLSGADTLSGNITISAGTLKLDAGGTIASVPNIYVAGGAALDVSTLTTALTLASGQNLIASGSGTAGTIATDTGKGLTLGTSGSPSALTFSAYDGSDAPLTVTGAGSLVLAANNPVTVTVNGSSLTAGDYLLVSGGSTAVSGTAPTSVTVNGTGGLAGGLTAWLVIGSPTPGQLYLHVASLATPSIALADNGTQVAAASVTAGTTANILHTFQLGVTTADARLTGVSFTTAGTYAAADVSNFKVWYSADNTLQTVSDTLLGTITTSLSAGAHSLSSLSQTITAGSTGYFFITADIPGTATVADTINVQAVAPGDLTFFTGTASGSTTAGGLQTIAAPASPTITVTGTPLASFGNVQQNGMSSQQSFSVSGASLTGDITVTPPSGFQISTTSGSGYSTSPITLTQSSGAVAPTPIYVVFAPPLVQAYSANVACTSPGATEQDIAVSGTGIYSSVSDIIADAGFTYPQNIAYGSYQETTLTSSSLAVAQFILRDGGASGDLDSADTTLTAISFSVANSANLRRVGLFDGTTELAEVAAASTVTFSSLSATAADGGTKTLTLRASFKSTVTDNQQFSFTVSSATASTSGSGFAAANAGGAASSTAGDNNRIAVTATKLAFSAVPGSVGLNKPFAVTVQAQDANGSLDVDSTASVTLTLATGTGTFSGASGNLVAGAKTFTALTYNKMETFTLQAADVSSVLSSATSGAITAVSVVIAEVYGGGGNTGAIYTNDFIVLFNRGSTVANVRGWTVQYGSATSTGAWSGLTTLAATDTYIPAGYYFLVQEAAGTGAAGMTPMPAADATGTINMSATAGKVALCSDNTVVTNTSLTGGNILDLVGFGTTANGYEGSGPAPAPANATSVHRLNGGCTDTDNNSTDFVVGAPTPQNSSNNNPMECPTINPVQIITPLHDQVAWITTNVTFTVMASGDPTLTYVWSWTGGPIVNGTHYSGATTSSLTISNVTAADNGTYTVTVDSTGTPGPQSSMANLSVIDPAPVIVYQPPTQTDLRGVTAFFTVAAQGVPSFNTNYTFSYQWQTNNGGTWVSLADSGQISGSTTARLTISNVGDANAGDYQVVVTSGTPAGLSTASSTATLSVADTGTPLVTWDFNNPDLNPASPGPSQGEATATAALVGNADGFFYATPYDANDFGTPVGAWGTDSYPSQYTMNKSSGVQFNVSTIGLKDISISYDYRNSGAASKYVRLQYTTDGSTFTDYPVAQSIAGTTFNGPQVFSLAGFPNVRENPNFGVRLVAEFESTALGTANASYTPVTGTYSTSGTLSYDLVKISATRVNGNTPPTIAPIADVVTPDTTLTVTVPITVTAGSAAVSSVVASSYNPTVAGDPAVAGDFSSLTITANGPDGQATIKVTATDANGEVTVALFNFTVNPPNLPPTIAGLPTLTNTLVNQTLTIPITATDDHTVFANLMLTAYSSNQTVVAAANVSVSKGTDPACTLTITPATGAAGVAPISVIALDDGYGAYAPKSTTNTFIVIVRPSTNVVMNDFFDYPAGPIISNSCGLWQNHSGTLGQMSVQAGGTLRVTSGDSEDVHVPLLGAPYLHTDSSVTLYSSFLVRFQDLPLAGGAYFAHFRNEVTGAATGYGARVWASIDNAASGKFRLGIANGQGGDSSSGQVAQDLSLSTTYLVVTRFVPFTGVATIWINPANESSPSVTATDVSNDPANIQNPIDVTSYAFRQASGEGTMTVDSLRVGTSFAAVIPARTHIESISGTTLSYSGGLGARYILLTNTASITTPLSTWGRAGTNATSPGSFTIPAVGTPAPEMFYNIKSE